MIDCRLRPLCRIAILCLLAFALRLYLIDTQPIWWDEAISFHLATSSLADLIADRAANVHPPLYFFLFKGWVALAGLSAFSLRFFSLLSNIPLIPAVYAFGRRWWGRNTGSLAAVLVTFSPLYVIYSQEARVYALLPLVYIALLAQVERLTRDHRPASWRDWFLLAIVEAVGLYLHYTLLFAVAYINLLLLLRLRRRRADLIRWLTSASLVGLLGLPWLVAVIANRAAILVHIGLQSPLAEPIPPGHFVRLLWTFQWSGLTPEATHPVLQLFGWGIALLLALASLWLLRDAATVQETLRLLAHWILPLSAAPLIWLIWPLSHPRYVSIFAVALLLLCAYVLTRLVTGGWAKKGLATLLSVAIVAGFTLSLQAYFFDPAFAKDDTRGLSEALATSATAQDLILVPPGDWTIPYYYQGPASVVGIWPGDRPDDWAQLATLAEGKQRVYLVGYQQSSYDPRAISPFTLESAGSQIDRWHFKGMTVRVYQLDRPITSPETSADNLRPNASQAVHFGPLRLAAAWVEQDAPADTAVTVALRWRLEGPIDQPLWASLRLRDAEGWEWATQTRLLLDDQSRHTDRWEPGQEATTYHRISLPPGIPPLAYTPVVGIFWMEGESVQPLELLDGAGNPWGYLLDLAEASLGLPLGLQNDPYGVADQPPLWDAPLTIDEGLQLTGTALSHGSLAPGQSLFVTLRWQGPEPALSTPLEASLTLEQQGEALLTESGPVGGLYPIDRWLGRQTIVEHRRLIIPPGASDGPADLILQIGGQRIELGQVEIVAGEHLFEVPPMTHEMGVRFGDVAELLGYDLEQTEVAWGEPVTLTLYWRALDGAAQANYTVFTHILAADGRLVGQHDGLPAEGFRPTLGWLPGEIIIDRHAMTFSEPYTGPARVQVGLYDPLTMQRVPAAGGEDSALLPTVVEVEAQ